MIPVREQAPRLTARINLHSPRRISVPARRRHAGTACLVAEGQPAPRAAGSGDETGGSAGDDLFTLLVRNCG